MLSASSLGWVARGEWFEFRVYAACLQKPESSGRGFLAGLTYVTMLVRGMGPGGEVLGTLRELSEVEDQGIAGELLGYLHPRTTSPTNFFLSYRIYRHTQSFQEP